MTREIKFRAWLKLSKEMVYNIERGERLDDNFSLYLDNDNAVVMQFTGLHDKNGKEIYEGDIVKTHFDKTNSYEAYDELGEVVFSSLEWRIKNKVHGNNHRFYSHSEVIGNIYENSELLETN